MIFLDYSPVAMASIYSQMKYISEDGVIQDDIVRHMIFNSIRRLNKLHTAKFGKMVICFDSDANWRKEEFELYKANRKKSRDEQGDDGFDWDSFWGIFNEVKEAVKENLPYVSVEVSGAEADDVIGTLVRYEFETNPKTPTLIISTDGDFEQLQRYPNVKQYTPTFDKWVVSKDPMEKLYTKIVKGDKKDGVPNIKSPDNSIIDSIRQKIYQQSF